MPDDISNSSLLSKLTVREVAQMLVAAFFIGGIWVSLNARLNAEELATKEEKAVDKAILSTQQQFKTDISEIKTTQRHLAEDMEEFKADVAKDNDEIKAMLNKLLDRELQR